MDGENTSPPDPTTAAAGPKVYHAEIDPQLKDRALEQIRDAVKGNGIKLENVEIENFKGETLEFLAVTALKLDAQTAIKHQAGKISGSKILASANMFQEEIGKEINKISRSPDVTKRIYDAVLERKDKGLAVKNERMKMPFLNKDFVVHEPCNPCNGQGKVKCTRCHGQGQERCPQCQARGSETCPTCGGRQYIQGQNNQNQQCMRCNGAGRISCTMCHESREIQCRQCKSTGTLQCNQCNGHAWNSIICMATIDVVGLYEYDRANIPPKAVDKLDRLGADIEHHAHIEVVPKPPDVEKNSTDIAMNYHIKVPMADVNFKIKSLDVAAFLFGEQGTLYDTPPFLEKIMGKGIKALKNAALSQCSDVAQNIKAAGRYRTLRHIIKAVAKAGPKKAMSATIKNHPLGLSEAGTKKLVMMAHKALSNLNKKSRTTAFALGTISALTSFGAYMLIVHPALASSLTKGHAELAVQILVAFLAVGIGYWISHSYLSYSLKKSVKNLFGK